MSDPVIYLPSWQNRVLLEIIGGEIERAFLYLMVPMRKLGTLNDIYLKKISGTISYESPVGGEFHWVSMLLCH